MPIHKAVTRRLPGYRGGGTSTEGEGVLSTSPNGCRQTGAVMTAPSNWGYARVPVGGPVVAEIVPYAVLDVGQEGTSTKQLFILISVLHYSHPKLKFQFWQCLNPPTCIN